MPTLSTQLRCHLLRVRHARFPIQRDLSFLSFLKLFLCLAATFSGLRLWDRAQFPNFPSALSLLRRPLFGMADRGRKSGVSLSPLVGGGKRTPRGGGWSYPFRQPLTLGHRPWEAPGCRDDRPKSPWLSVESWPGVAGVGQKEGVGMGRGARSLFPSTPFSLIVGPSYPPVSGCGSE